MIEHLKKLQPEVVEQFLASRNPEALDIPPKLAEYILQINEASNLNKQYRTISECAEQLKKSFPELSIHTCKSRIYDAIAYLHQGCAVTSDAWLLYYADMLMNLYEENLKEKKFKEARLCIEKSCEYYIRATANIIDPERLKFKPQIVSADMELMRMGVKKQGLLNSYKKALSIIDTLDVTDMEKQRMIDEVERELNVKDIPHEEIRN